MSGRQLSARGLVANLKERHVQLRIGASMARSCRKAWRLAPACGAGWRWRPAAAAHRRSAPRHARRPPGNEPITARCRLLRASTYTHQHRGVHQGRDHPGHLRVQADQRAGHRAELRQQPLDLRWPRAHRRASSAAACTPTRRWSSSTTTASRAPSITGKPAEFEQQRRRLRSRWRTDTRTRSSTTWATARVRLTRRRLAVATDRTRSQAPLIVYNIRAQRVQAASRAGQRSSGCTSSSRPHGPVARRSPRRSPNHDAH